MTKEQRLNSSGESLMPECLSYYKYLKGKRDGMRLDGGTQPDISQSG